MKGSEGRRRWQQGGRDADRIEDLSSSMPMCQTSYTGTTPVTAC